MVKVVLAASEQGSADAVTASAVRKVLTSDHFRDIIRVRLMNSGNVHVVIVCLTGFLRFHLTIAGHFGGLDGKKRKLIRFLTSFWINVACAIPCLVQLEHPAFRMEDYYSFFKGKSNFNCLLSVDRKGKSISTECCRFKRRAAWSWRLSNESRNGTNKATGTWCGLSLLASFTLLSFSFCLWAFGILIESSVITCSTGKWWLSGRPDEIHTHVQDGQMVQAAGHKLALCGIACPPPGSLHLSIHFSVPSTKSLMIR